MRHTRWMTRAIIFLSISAAVFAAAVPPQAGPALKAADLLSPADGWTASEPPERYTPESLFEYIDGAAENFISYDFVELALCRYRGADGKAEMTVEIYDMGMSDNAFGIYGSERYPESKFLPLGIQGYIEDGVLNFFADRFYIKMMAYEAGDQTDAALKAFAAAILKRIPRPGEFPLAVRAFSPAGLVPNSEKFILKDFLGLTFLSRGTIASYREPDGGEYDAFVIEAKSPAEAEKTIAALAGHFPRAAQAAGAASGLVRLKDLYLLNILVMPQGRFICGAVKVKDGAEAAAEKTVRATAGFLAGK